MLTYTHTTFTQDDSRLMHACNAFHSSFLIVTTCKVPSKMGHAKSSCFFRSQYTRAWYPNILFSCPKVLMNDWIYPSQCGIGGVTWYFLIEMTAWITISCRKITGTLSRARMLGFDSWVNKWLTCFVSFLLLAMCSCVYKLGFSTNTSSVTVFGCHKGTRFAHQRGLENIWVVRIWRCNMMTFC